jgi:hypothetical protein
VKHGHLLRELSELVGNGLQWVKMTSSAANLEVAYEL